MTIYSTRLSHHLWKKTLQDSSGETYQASIAQTSYKFRTAKKTSKVVRRVSFNICFIKKTQNRIKLPQIHHQLKSVQRIKQKMVPSVPQRRARTDATLFRWVHRITKWSAMVDKSIHLRLLSTYRVSIASETTRILSKANPSTALVKNPNWKN